MRVFIGGVLALLLATAAQADGGSLSVGGDYSTGKYGSRDSTDVFYMPIIGTYQSGAFTYKFTVPWLRVRGPGNVVPSGIGGSGTSTSSITTTGVVCTSDRRGSNSGSGSSNSGSGSSGSGSSGSGSSGSGSRKVEDNTCTTTSTTTTTTTTTTKSSGTSQSRRTTESGLGDIVASLGYNVLDTENWVVDVTGRIKFGTADEDKNLGTGKTDYAAQINVDRYFGAPYVSFGFGYRRLGEPSGVDFRGVTYGSLGAGYKLGNKGDVGVSYDWATAAVKNAPKPQELSIYASYRINDHYKLNANLYTGLSNANPDVGGGVTLAYYF